MKKIVVRQTKLAVLEIIQGGKVLFKGSTNEIKEHYGVNQNKINQWRGHGYEIEKRKGTTTNDNIRKNCGACLRISCARSKCNEYISRRIRRRKAPRNRNERRTAAKATNKEKNHDGEFARGIFQWVKD